MFDLVADLTNPPAQKMKVVIFFLLFFSVTFCNAQGGVEILVVGKKSCTTPVDLKFVFKYYDLETKIILHAADVIRAEVIAGCGQKVVTHINASDSALYLVDAFMDLYYKLGSADSAHRDIVTRCHNPPNRLASFELNTKGGIIFGLDMKTDRIRILKFNSCAAEPKFRKIVAAMKSEKIFEKVIVVFCGGNPSDIIEW